MTVLDNIKLGRHCHLKTGALGALFYSPAARREEEALRQEIEERIIDFLEIDHIRKAPVSALSYGLQKRVELARALAMKPDADCCSTNRAGRPEPRRNRRHGAPAFWKCAASGA